MKGLSTRRLCALHEAVIIFVVLGLKWRACNYNHYSFDIHNAKFGNNEADDQCSQSVQKQIFNLNYNNIHSVVLTMSSNALVLLLKQSWLKYHRIHLWRADGLQTEILFHS